MLRVARAAAFLSLAAAVTGCGALDEFYEQPGRYPCQTNADCVGGFACGPSQTDPAVRVCQPACRVHGDCAADAVCNPDGACVTIDATQCRTLVRPLDDDNVVVLGALTPLEDYSDREQASVLAVQEINDAGGISGGRRLMLIGCDDGGRVAQAQAAARHLASLGAQAVIGPYFSGVFIETFTSVLKPHDIFTISPSATSPLITTLDDANLAWRTISSDEAQAAAMTALILLRTPQHVLMLAKDDAYGGFLQSTVGGTLLPELTVDGYRAMNYPEVDLDATATVAAALAPALSVPDLIAIAGTSEVPQLIEAIEAEVSRRGLPPPQYVLSEGAKGPTLLQLLNSQPELASRIEGTDPSILNDAVYSGFAARYLGATGGTPQTAAPNAYDAVYVVGYALSTTEGLYPGGAAIAAGVPRLVGGAVPVTTAPESVGTARMALADGGTIELTGTSGGLDFDLATGDTEGGVTGWTVEVLGGGEARFETTGVFVTDENGQGEWMFDPP